MSLVDRVTYEDGRYPFLAGAVFNPGDVITRPSGTLAIYDGLNSCRADQMISPDPVHPYPTRHWPCATADTWAAAAQLYYHSGSGEVNTTASGGTLVGRSITAKTAGMTEIHVESTPN